MIKKTYNSPSVKVMEINSDVLLKESVEIPTRWNDLWDEQAIGS